MNRLYITIIVVIFALGNSINLNAQELISIDQVLSEVKENNYDLKTAQLNVAASEVLTSKYNRGYMPTLGLNAGINYGLNGQKTVYNEDFEFLNQTIRNNPNYTATIGASAAYLLYDGGQRNLRNEKNQANVAFAGLQVKNINQQLAFNASQLYYSIAQVIYNVNLLEESVAISKERKRRTKTYYEYGSRNKVDLLNAQVDITRDSINLVATQNDIENLKWQLNQLTLREDTNYSIDTSFVLLYELSTREELRTTLLASNVELIALKSSMDLLKFDLAIAEKINAPTISANGSYNVNYQQNSDQSPLQRSRNNGLNLGLTGNWNILDGGQQKVQEQLAKIDQELVENDWKNKENELTVQLNRLWNSYQNALLTIRLERQNIRINRSNFDLVKSLYENGQQSSVEFRQAQINLINAQSQYYQARTSAKLIEVEIDFLLSK